MSDFSDRCLLRENRKPVCDAKLVPLGREKSAFRKVTAKAPEAYVSQGRLKLQEARSENYHGPRHL